MLNFYGGLVLKFFDILQHTNKIGKASPSLCCFGFLLRSTMHPTVLLQPSTHDISFCL